jgi:hypothetical protein
MTSAEGGFIPAFSEGDSPQERRGGCHCGGKIYMLGMCRKCFGNSLFGLLWFFSKGK